MEVSSGKGSDTISEESLDEVAPDSADTESSDSDILDSEALDSGALDSDALDSDALDSGVQADDSTDGGEFAEALASESSELNFGSGDEVRALQAELVSLGLRLQESEDKALRWQAESDNVRMRLSREKQDLQKYAVSPLAVEMFGVVDNLRRAIASVPDGRRDDEDLRNFLQGLEMTELSFDDALQKCHIEKVGEVGEAYDYNVHQAVSEVESAEYSVQTVIEVLQQGYKLHDRLLRAATVIITKA